MRAEPNVRLNCDYFEIFCPHLKSPLIIIFSRLFCQLSFMCSAVTVDDRSSRTGESRSIHTIDG